MSTRKNNLKMPHRYNEGDIVHIEKNGSFYTGRITVVDLYESYGEPLYDIYVAEKNILLQHQKEGVIIK